MAAFWLTRVAQAAMAANAPVAPAVAPPSAHSQEHESCRCISELSTPPPAKKVVLTFDDGPQPGHTEFILATLKKYDIKAQKYPELVAQIRADGHEAIGNHSWGHPNFHDIGASEQTLEVLKTEILLEDKQTPKLFRYPYGNSTCDTNALLREIHGNTLKSLESIVTRLRDEGFFFTSWNDPEFAASLR